VVALVVAALIVALIVVGLCALLCLRTLVVAGLIIGLLAIRLLLDLTRRLGNVVGGLLLVVARLLRGASRRERRGWRRPRAVGGNRDTDADRQRKRRNHHGKKSHIHALLRPRSSLKLAADSNAGPQQRSGR